MRRSHLHFLDDIREAAGKIQEYTKGMSYQEFLSDRRTKGCRDQEF